jgi:hypothetical protein
MAVCVAEFNSTLCVILKCWWTWWVLEPSCQGKTEVFGEKFALVPQGLQCEECGSWRLSGYSTALDGSTLSLRVKYHLRTLREICGSHHGVVEGSCLLDVALYSCGCCGGWQYPLLARLLAPHSTAPLGVAYLYTKTLPSALHYYPPQLACTLISPHPHNPPYFAVMLFLSQH